MTELFEDFILWNRYDHGEAVLQVMLATAFLSIAWHLPAQLIIMARHYWEKKDD